MDVPAAKESAVVRFKMIDQMTPRSPRGARKLTATPVRTAAPLELIRESGLVRQLLRYR
jgi:hypothetical protein